MDLNDKRTVVRICRDRALFWAISQQGFSLYWCAAQKILLAH